MSETQPPRQMPHSIDSERAVLSSALRDPVTLNLTRPIIAAEDDWYLPQHRILWRVLCGLQDIREEIAPSTVRAALDATRNLDNVGGADYLIDLYDYVGTTVTAQAEARRVAAFGLRRRQLRRIAELYEEGMDPALTEEDYAHRIQSVALELTRRVEVAELVRFEVCVKEAMDWVKRAAQEETVGIPVPFLDLARILLHFEPGDTYVIGGNAKMGKTTLLMEILARLSESGYVGALFSLEMNARQLGLRGVSRTSRVPIRDMRSGRIDQTQWGKLADGAHAASAWPLWVCRKQQISVAEIAALCRRAALAGRLDVVAIDYIQLVTGSMRYGRQTSREQELSGISRDLKGLAEELNVPILIAAQCNRDVEKRSDKRPVRSDLRESGAIANDAGAVCLLYRDEVYNPQTEDKGIAEVIVDAHRHGETGTAKLRWHGETARLAPLD